MHQDRNLFGKFEKADNETTPYDICAALLTYLPTPKDVWQPDLWRYI